MRTGILLAVIGICVVLRTVRTDSQGKTLVDRITGK
jgi:hypothetical protein